MSAPERIFINKVFGQHPEDWDFTHGKDLTKRQLSAKTMFIRADLVAAKDARIAELERQLAEARAEADRQYDRGYKCGGNGA